MPWPLSGQFILSSNSILAFLLVVLSEVRSHRHPVSADLLLAQCSHVRCFLIWNGKYPEHSYLKRLQCLWQKVLLLSSWSCLCLDCFHRVLPSNTEWSYVFEELSVEWPQYNCYFKQLIIAWLLRKLVTRYQRNVKYMNHINYLPSLPLTRKMKI